MVTPSKTSRRSDIDFGPSLESGALDLILSTHSLLQGMISWSLPVLRPTLFAHRPMNHGLPNLSVNWAYISHRIQSE